ncbi:MAG TPA: C2 family cysteine protease [Candidatus Obscuribacterales bacterium]
MKSTGIQSSLTKIAISLVFFAQSGLSASALAPADEAAVKNAWTLYNQKKYAASADAFESLIRSSIPNGRLYYYAALANRGCNRAARAKQLCQYVITNFPGTPEAAYARRLCPDAAPTTLSAGEGLPETLKGNTLQEAISNPEKMKALAEAISKKDLGVAAAAARVSPMMARSKGGKLGERVFTAADIAKDGAHGIDQTYYPNCWFESSMSALAMLPRGQKLMADMIRYGDKPGTYIVRFPGDGVEYTVTEEKLDKSGIHDKALWASLIEYAQTQKFGARGGQLYEGLGYLTGQKAEQLLPASASEQELYSFIDGAVKSQNPIVCGSNHYWSDDLPDLVVPGHAYTIVGFEPSRGMIKIRNPHGANSQRFSLENDRNHEKFEQLDDGVFKIHVSLFKQYFSQVARSFI